MQLYLPIAEVSVNAFLLLGLGGIVGFLSGMFGVGGGFLITPLLFLIPVTVTASEAGAALSARPGAAPASRESAASGAKRVSRRFIPAG